jgi:hypothetical protein
MKRDSWVLLIGISLLFFPILISSQASEVEESVGVSVTIEAEEEPPVIPPPPGGPWPPPPWPPDLPVKVIFKGKAYPNAFLTLLKNGEATATFFGEKSGLFEKEVGGLSEGTYAFGIWAEDTEGRKSVTLNFTIELLRGTVTTISGIFIPPTIEINPSQLERGQMLDVFGQAFPESEINVFVSPKEMVEKTKTSLEGNWLYELDTKNLEKGDHEVRAKAFYRDGEQSQFSQTLSFSVILQCWGADLNFDEKVDIVDFSILLYFWEQTNPKNQCTDINSDGIVDIFDFSLMAYQWTG